MFLEWQSVLASEWWMLTWCSMRCSKRCLLLNQEKNKTEKKLMFVIFREGKIKYSMTMWFVSVCTESPWKNFYIIAVRFLNVVFASLSSKNSSLFKPLIEHDSFFSVPKCKGKKCGIFLTALHCWVVVFMVNFMKTLKFLPIESIGFCGISNIDCGRNFY